MKLRVFNYIILITSIFSPELQCQEITISDQNLNGYYTNYFNARFQSINDGRVDLGDMSVYKKHKVKKINIYEAHSNTLYFSYTLDASGKLLLSGCLNHYFTTNKWQEKGNKNTGVECWYEKEVLVRTDSTVQTMVVYKNGDTIMQFMRTDHKSHKRGYLLNDRNKHYNKYYLNKEIDLPEQIRGMYENKHEVYFDKKLKTDFDSSKLYTAGIKNWDDGFCAARDSAGVEIVLKDLFWHRFYKQYNSKKKDVFLVSGEFFYEPGELNDFEFCGSHYGRLEEKQSRTAYGWTKNAKGLSETYTQYYHPEEGPEQTNQIWMVRYEYFR